jgi:hypothetical protein
MNGPDIDHDAPRRQIENTAIAINPNQNNGVA